MNFAEARFWGLLLGGLGFILLLRFFLRFQKRVSFELFDKLTLFSLGIFLLFCVSWVTFAIFLIVAIGSFLGLKWVLNRDDKARRYASFILIFLQLLPLIAYKYADFGLNGILGLNLAWFRDLVIPVGISFYTFQKVAFVVDTLVFRQPLPRFVDYLNFAGFFPQIVAGPIERRSDLLPQMEQFRWRWNAENLNCGIGWVVVGLFFKMCLADNLANYFDGSSTRNAYLIWLANLLFGLRIYYDFAGYSLIAFGIARCLGVKLTLNFQSPYCAASMTEFWRRWHVTLSQWFRDYLYIPMGGGRVRWWMLNVMIVFVTSGIWHGAGWNFVFWGALHGAALIVNRLLGKMWTPMAFLGWLATMLVTFVAWLGFYESQTHLLSAKICTLFTPTAYGTSAVQELQANLTTANGFVMICFLLMAGLTLAAEWLCIARRNEPYCFFTKPWVLILLIAATIALSPGQSNGFIYFAF